MDGLQLDPKENAAVKKFSLPLNQNYVCSFMGSASYYRRYGPECVATAHPLREASENSSVLSQSSKSQESNQCRKAR